MTRRLLLPTSLGALCFAAAVPWCFAQQRASVVTGSVTLGARSVDIGGTETKFREDIDLDDGVRLFGVNVRYEPASAAPGTAVDRLELDAVGLGGEPFESIRFGVRKYGAYRLALDRRRSRFFYDDTILPAALASVGGSTGGDYHTFEFERIRDTADLDIELAPATQLSLGLERQTRTGDSTTTLDIERDEFDLDRPLDESLNALTFGVRHAFRRMTIVATEDLSDFANTSELLLPGATPGRNLADAASLAFFVRNQSYDYSSRAHGVRLLGNPTTRLDLTAGWRHENLDLGLDASERSQGTTFAGAPLAISLAGGGEVDRDIELGELDVGFAVTPRLRIVGGARHSTLEQTGASALGADSGASAWAITTDGFEAGVELALSAAWTVAAGWSRERRDADYDWAFDALAAARHSATERDGYFARLALTTDGGWHVTASVEDDSIDAPYTLAAPTASRRYVAGARRRWSNGLSLSANYRDTDVENDESHWLADTEQADVRVLYARARLQTSAGYTRIALARSIDQVVTAGTRQVPFAIDYATDAMLRDASARWQVSPRFAVGGDARTYDAHGSVRVSRDDWRAYGEIGLGPDYLLEVAYRAIDYVEDAFDDYDARILEVAVRVNW